MRHLVLALLLAGCGAGDVPADPDAGVDAAGIDASGVKEFFPLKIGASWAYRVTDPMFPGAPAETKTQTVEAFEDVGGEKAGVMAFRLKTVKPGDETLTWQVTTSAGLTVRHREREFTVVGASSTLRADNFYFPFKLRIDGTMPHATLGAVWETMHDEKIYDSSAPAGKIIAKTERWTVEAVDEMITVPAGMFSTIRLRRQVLVGASGGEGADKTFWFAEGVGKIKETGGQTEELSAYSLP